MRIGTVLAVATMLSCSPALAQDVLSVEPCHAIRVQYDTGIREVYVADDTLVEAKVPALGQRLLILLAKPRTTTQTVERGNQTITTSSTSCLDAVGTTTLMVLDANGNEIFPSTPKSTRNEVVVQWRGRTVYVGQVPYFCGSS